MTLEEAVATLERKFVKVQLHDGTPPPWDRPSVAPNGEPYITYIMAGAKKEGDPIRSFADCEARLADVWLTTMMAAATNKWSILYWREKPSLLRFKMPTYRDIAPEIAPFLARGEELPSWEIEPSANPDGPLFQTLCRCVFT